jgi:hypothetical protein
MCSFPGVGRCKAPPRRDFGVRKHTPRSFGRRRSPGPRTTPVVGRLELLHGRKLHISRSRRGRSAGTAPVSVRAATMAFQDVALPALRSTTGRVGAVLGLPEIVDHLFDVSPLPDLPEKRRRLVRPRPQAPAADRPRAEGVLGGTPGCDAAAADRCVGAMGPAAPATGRRRRARRAAPTRLRPSRAHRRSGNPDRAARRGSARVAAEAASGRRGNLDEPDEPVRRAGRLRPPQLTGAAGSPSGQAG